MLRVLPNYPHISKLDNGVYIAKWYAQTFELEDGRKFNTDPIGVRQSQRIACFRQYKVINGNINNMTNRNFSYKRTALFTKYYDIDDFIVSKASELGIALYGGTGLQYWCRYLGVDFYRDRSVDDLDFTCDYNDKENIKKFADFLISLNFRLKTVKGDAGYIYRFINKDKKLPISIDVFYHTYKIDKSQIININGDLLWSPLFMFVTKLQRYGDIHFLENDLWEKVGSEDKAKKDRLDLLTDILLTKKLGISKNECISYMLKYPYLEDNQKSVGIDIIESGWKLNKVDKYTK